MKLQRSVIEDVTARGLPREVERHQCTVQRLEQLLADLGDPLEESATETERIDHEESGSLS